MVHRDPDTGQFMPDDSMMSQFDDIEVASFRAGVGIEAANLGGATGFAGGTSQNFEGLELIDYDEFVDRNEELHLLSAHHAMSVYANSTGTADGTVAVSAEISADPSNTTSVVTSTASVDGNDIVGFADTDDTIDLVGRRLFAVGHEPFSDSGGGVGGGGSAGEDRYMSSSFPAEFGRFHPRDELFANGQITVWNIADAGVHAQIDGQHVYGVIED